MKKFAFGALLFVGILFLPSHASAQVTFTQPNVTSPAQATGFTYKLYVTPLGGVQGAAITVAMTCSGTAPNVACTGPSASVIAAGAIITGAKTVITATDPATGSESAQSLPFQAGAGVPGSLLIR